jgi:hypothetical protein
MSCQSMYEASIALNGLSCFVTSDLARDLANDLMSLVGFISLSVCLCVCLFVCLLVCLSVCLSTSLSSCLSVHVFCFLFVVLFTAYRDELVCKITEICSQGNYHYITNFEWSIDRLHSNKCGVTSGLAVCITGI